jgi:hypothetical protein
MLSLISEKSQQGLLTGNDELLNVKHRLVIVPLFRDVNFALILLILCDVSCVQSVLCYVRELFSLQNNTSKEQHG